MQNETPSTERFRSEIVDLCRRGMEALNVGPVRLGTLAVRDGRLVGKLLDGENATLKQVQRLEAYIRCQLASAGNKTTGEFADAG